ncbi:MAG: hypothetical protein KKA84_07240 [Bacteroidetes bacterium]|nr:hypothetical protein [Bacteroidota bacterium]
MHRILADNNKNRLYLILSGNVDHRESLNMLDKVIKELENLRPGFDVISNLSTYTPISMSVDINVSSLLKTIKEHGVGKAVRIIDRSKFVVNSEMNFLDKYAGIGNFETVMTLTEAEEILGN